MDLTRVACGAAPDWHSWMRGHCYSRGKLFIHSRHLPEYRAIQDRRARMKGDEANRLMDIAQQPAHLRWQVYEKMAARSAAEFPADGRRGDV